MKTSFEELPTSLRKKKLALLKADLASGKPLEKFTQEERDLLHLETSEENRLYWKAECERTAESDADRLIYCQSVARSMLVVLRSLEPPIEDNDHVDGILEAVLFEADRLPKTH